MVIATTEPAHHTLNTVHLDIGDLHRLLVAVSDILYEMPYERDGERDSDLDRVASLVRISADFAARIDTNITDNFQAILEGDAI